MMSRAEAARRRSADGRVQQIGARRHGRSGRHGSIVPQKMLRADAARCRAARVATISRRASMKKLPSSKAYWSSFSFADA